MGVPAVGPVAEGFDRTSGGFLLLIVRWDNVCVVTARGECLQAGNGADEVSGPWPGLVEVEIAAALAAHEFRDHVQQPVAQGFGFGFWPGPVEAEQP